MAKNLLENKSKSPIKSSLYPQLNTGEMKLLENSASKLIDKSSSMNRHIKSNRGSEKRKQINLLPSQQKSAINGDKNLDTPMNTNDGTTTPFSKSKVSAINPEIEGTCSAKKRRQRKKIKQESCDLNSTLDISMKSNIDSTHLKVETSTLPTKSGAHNGPVIKKKDKLNGRKLLTSIRKSSKEVIQNTKNARESNPQNGLASNFNVHNAQFYNYQPQTVNCMAICPKNNLLAVGRSNATVEVYSIENKFYQIGQIPGCLLDSVESMVWVKERLFATGVTGYLVELDLDLWNIKGRIPTVGQSALSMISMGDNIAIGTDSGSITLFKVEDSGFEIGETLPQIEGRVLSLAWEAQHPFTLISGGEGVLYVWDLRQMRVVKKFSLAKETSRRATLIWSLVFAGSCLVSADSQGYVSFWDPHGCGQLQTFHSHLADVLTLTVSPSGREVFASGVDPIVHMFVLQTDANHPTGRGRWIQSLKWHASNRDIRSIVCHKETLLCAGLAAQIILLSTKKEGHLRGSLSVGPQRSILQLLPWQPLVGRPLVLLKYPERLEIVTLGSSKLREGAQGSAAKRRKVDKKHPRGNDIKCNGDSTVKELGPFKLCDILPRPNESIVCSCLSSNGQLLAYSDTSRTRLLSLVYANSNTAGHLDNTASSTTSTTSEQVTLSISRTPLPALERSHNLVIASGAETPITITTTSTSCGGSSTGSANPVKPHHDEDDEDEGMEDCSESSFDDEEDEDGCSTPRRRELPPCHLMSFTPDSKKLVVVEARGQSQMVLLDCSTGGELWRVTPGEDEMNARVHVLALSPSGEYAALGCQDGLVIVYSIKDHKRMFHVSRRLHSNPPRPTAITFDRDSDKMLIFYSNAQIHEIVLSEVRSSNPYRYLNEDFVDRIEKALCLDHVHNMEYVNETEVLIHTSQNIIIINLAKSLKMAGFNNESIRTTKHNKLLLHTGVINESELLIVSTSDAAISSKLPQPMAKKKFGV